MSSDGSTSRSLLLRARDGDSAAWSRLITLYAPLVEYWCRKSGLASDDVADVAQETFVAAARGLPGFRKERPGDTFRGWLRTIAANKMRDRFRRAGHEARGHGGTEMARWWQQCPERDAPDPADESVPFSRVVAAALQRIRPGFRDNTWLAFWRTTVDGRPPDDVGSELDMSPGAVRVAKSRVLSKLRAELGDEPGA